MWEISNHSLAFYPIMGILRNSWNLIERMKLGLGNKGERNVLWAQMQELYTVYMKMVSEGSFDYSR